MIHGVSIPNIHFIATSGARMSVPVDPASLLYSNFQHVSGIPAPEGSHGVSIPRLHLLDILISQLNQAGQNLSFESANPFNGIDALIESVTSQIQNSAANPYAPAPQTALLFDLSS